jgi:hypothetical protein
MFCHAEGFPRRVIVQAPSKSPPKGETSKKSFKALSLGEGWGEALASCLAMTRGVNRTPLFVAHLNDTLFT